MPSGRIRLGSATLSRILGEMRFLVRLAVALAVLAPAFVLGWLTPWTRMLGIAFGAFVIAEAVGQWLRRSESARRDRIALAVAVVAVVAATAIAIVMQSHTAADGRSGD